MRGQIEFRSIDEWVGAMDVAIVQRLKDRPPFVFSSEEFSAALRLVAHRSGVNRSPITAFTYKC